MPRPKRIQDGEATDIDLSALEPEEKTPVEVQSEAENAPIDTDNGDDTLPAQIGDADDEWTQSIAKRMGWVPKEDWTRDPKDHISAKAFIEKAPEAIDAQAERLRRYSQVAQAAAEEARRQGIREAEERLLHAHRSGDETEVKRAAQAMAASQIPAETQAWLTRNPWFHTEPAAAFVAKQTVERAAKEGLSTAEQLKAGEDEARRRFPELFGLGMTPEPRREATLATARAPQVQPGGRSVAPTPKGPKGWDDMPAQDKRAFERAFLGKLSRGATSEADTKAQLAKSYWADTKARTVA